MATRAQRAQRARGEGAWRQQMRRHESQVGEAAQLRRQADAMEEDIYDLLATANRIGERDGWTSVRYLAISADIRRLQADQKRLYAQATQLEKCAS